MKMNFEFYNGVDSYSDGSIENEIIEYEKEYDEGNIDEVFKTDLRWPVFYHLSPVRKNILQWYLFSKDAHVLEIGAGMGAITSVLCDKVAEVTSVELSRQRATSIATRCKDKDNLEIIVGNLNDIDFKGKQFDYITLIGVLEYAPLYTNSNNPYVDFLTHIKPLLKPDGKLLIAIENKFGMKYWLGAPEDHTGKKYDGIMGYEDKNYVQTFGKEELTELLKGCGLKNINYYYPLPDYKLPTAIFSDKYLPKDEDIDQYDIYYTEGTQVEFDERKAYKEVIRNGMFSFFANSFLVECSADCELKDIELKNQSLIPCGKNGKRFYQKNYEKKDYNSEVENLQMQVDQLQSQLKAIEASKAWKITKPLRAIRGLFK